MKVRHLAAAAALLWACVGCQQGDFPIAPVSGTVTVNGKPVAGVAVMFQPVAKEDQARAGHGSFGVTDAAGKYDLKLITVGEDQLGAVIGKHKVRFTAYTSPDSISDDPARKPPRPSVYVPAKYNQEVALVEFDVPSGGTRSADFALSK